MGYLNTIPARLALMAKDADARVRYADHYFQKVLDDIRRPAALIEIPEADQTPYAQGLLNPTETFDIVIVGNRYGQGAREGNASEDEVREIVENVIDYINKRPRLAFSNALALEAAPLGDLQGVVRATTRRGRVGVVSGGADGEGSFYGGTIHVLVEVFKDVEEVLVWSG